MPLSYIILSFILVSGMVYAVTARRLTPDAALTGAVVAICIFMGAGFTGVAMMTAFFIAGSVATSWKKELKHEVNAAEKSDERRTTGQVLANSGAAGIAGLLAYLQPQHAELFRLMLASSLASAAADTLSSELGMVYGRRFYNIISLKKDERGRDGVISMEGCLIGILGSGLIAVIYYISHHFGYPAVVIVISGTIGNLTDSLLGSTAERKGYIGNNMVNFLNTAIAALAAWLLI